MTNGDLQMFTTTLALPKLLPGCRPLSELIGCAEKKHRAVGYELTKVDDRSIWIYEVKLLRGKRTSEASLDLYSGTVIEEVGGLFWSALPKETVQAIRGLRYPLSRAIALAERQIPIVCASLENTGREIRYRIEFGDGRRVSVDGKTGRIRQITDPRASCRMSAEPAESCDGPRT